jgi:hypothetical protein
MRRRKPVPVKLIERPVRSIVRAIADAAERWVNADFPPRVRALDGVCRRTGYSTPVVEHALDRLFSSLTQSSIGAIVEAELGTLDVLDEFVPRHGRARVRALPIGRVGVLSSRTTIGVAIVPAIFALCAKCEVLVKDREDELVKAFFSTLAEELDELREAAVAQSWDGERDPRDLGDFAAVVAFGNDATLHQIRATLSPEARWIGFGSKASCGYVGRAALSDSHAARQIADGAARDVVLYDTEGCLSLHVLFVERGGMVSPADFAGILTRAIERASVEFPPSAYDASRRTAVAGARDLGAFRAAAGQAGRTYSDAAASYLVVLDPPIGEPPFFLPRAIAIHSVDSPFAASTYVARHRIPIEAIAVACMRPDVAEMAIRIGAARIAGFGTLQSPPLSDNHGGRPRIAEFVRWVSDET